MMTIHAIKPLRMALVMASAAMIALLSSPVVAETGRPNIVFILADNLGYGEVGAYGGGITRGAPTPRIDSLAKDGMRFLNFNMETQCTPSRSSLMTGRWAIRSGTHSVPFGGVADGLTQWEVTIGEALSDAGAVVLDTVIITVWLKVLAEILTVTSPAGRLTDVAVETFGSTVVVVLNSGGVNVTVDT